VGKKARHVNLPSRAGRWGGNIHALRLFESVLLELSKKRSNQPVKLRRWAGERIAGAPPNQVAARVKGCILDWKELVTLGMRYLRFNVATGLITLPEFTRAENALL
jgi:hypothetical protein